MTALEEHPKFGQLKSAVQVTTYLAVASFIFLIYVSMRPVNTTLLKSNPSQKKFADQVGHRVSIDSLISMSMGRVLIRPGQVVAAIKDNGTAKKLLSQLKLTGLTTSGGQPVAYIAIDKMGFQTVHVGEQILEFHVDDITADGVSLSLDGVTVKLTYY